MTFSEKLTFLMRMADVKNIDLARALHIDPSQISRLRRGERNSPKKPDLIESMASYFARQCGGDYQRGVIAQTLGKSYLSADTNIYEVENIICEWLLNGNDRGRPMASELKLQHDTDEQNGAADQAATDNHDLKTNEARVFYRNEGKRIAVHEAYSRLERMKTPCVIMISCDESNEWMTEDPEFFKHMTDALMSLLRKGFQIQRIIPPLADMNEASNTFALWFPLYITGNVKSYYLPKLRDGIYRRTRIIVPGEFALISSCVGLQKQSDMTMLFGAKPIVDNFEQEFIQYRGMCLPALEIYNPGTQYAVLSKRLGVFYSSPSASMRKSETLSFATIPRDKKIYFLNNSKVALMRLFCIHVSSVIMPNERTFFSRPITDVMRLATPEEVREGKVRYCFENATYTVAEYREHLRGISKLLNKYDSYNVVLSNNYPLDCVVYAKKGVGALLMMTQEPFYVIEIKAPNTLMALWDYLEQISLTGLTAEENKRRVLARLAETIARLDFDI